MIQRGGGPEPSKSVSATLRSLLSLTLTLNWAQSETVEHNPGLTSFSPSGLFLHPKKENVLGPEPPSPPGSVPTSPNAHFFTIPAHPDRTLKNMPCKSHRSSQVASTISCCSPHMGRTHDRERLAQFVRVPHLSDGPTATELPAVTWP